jgi:hypothetical protein
MSFMDQGADRPAPTEPAMQAVYKETARGCVCKLIPSEDAVPEGWTSDPAEAGWTGDVAPLVANVDDEAPVEAPAKKKKG